MDQQDRMKIYSIQNDSDDNLNLAGEKQIKVIPPTPPVIVQEQRVEVDRHQLKSKPMPLKASNENIEDKDKVDNDGADSSLLGYQEPKARLNGSTFLPTKGQRPHPQLNKKDQATPEEVRLSILSSNNDEVDVSIIKQIINEVHTDKKKKNGEQLLDDDSKMEDFNPEDLLAIIA